MIANRDYEHCAPLTWVGRVPVYLATAIAAGLGVTMVITAVLMAAGGMIGLNPYLTPLAYSSTDVLGSFSLWQFFTYVLVNPPGLWAALQLVMLAMFGSEVEKFVGRNAFAIFYGVLVLAIPLFLTVIAAIGIPSSIFDSGMVNFGVFAAFVFIYPRAQIFFGIEARWVLAALLGVYSLVLISGRAWPELGTMWWVCAVAALWMRKEGVMTIPLPEMPKMKRKPKFHVVKKEKVEEVENSIDPILEKISKHGIDSLTRAERERLERARTALLEKERPR